MVEPLADARLSMLPGSRQEAVYSELLAVAKKMDDVGFHTMGRFLDWVRSEYVFALQAERSEGGST